MCGASHEQEAMYSQQAAFYKVMTDSYNKAFAEQQTILTALQEAFMPILKQGPNQRGFSPEERNALDTIATEGVARNFAQAEKYAGERMAARGGSDFIPSGQDAEVHAGLAALAQGERSGMELSVEKADWDQGRHNYEFASGMLSNAASIADPVGFANAATNAGNAAANEANQIAAADNSVWQGVVGALSGIAGSAVGGWAEGKAGG